MTVPVPAGAGGVDREAAIEAVARKLNAHGGGPAWERVNPVQRDYWRHEAERIRKVFAAQDAAALAAAEQRADTLASAIERVQDVADELAESIANPEPPWHVDPRDEATAQRAMRWMHGLLRAALSSRPVQPEGNRT